MRIIQVPSGPSNAHQRAQQQGAFRCKDAFSTPRPPALLQREPDGQRTCGTREEENGDRLCGFEVPDDSDNRPVFAPETREQSVSKRGEGDEGALYSLNCFAERSLHTGEVASVLDQDTRPYLCRSEQRIRLGQDAHFPRVVRCQWLARYASAFLTRSGVNGAWRKRAD